MSRDQQKHFSKAPKHWPQSATQKLLFLQLSPPPFSQQISFAPLHRENRSRHTRNLYESATIPEESPALYPASPASFCSNGGSRQGLSKAHPFGFLPSPQEPHPSNRPLPNHRPQALLVPSPSAFVDQTMLVSRKEESYLAPKD